MPKMNDPIFLSDKLAIKAGKKLEDFLKISTYQLHGILRDEFGNIKDEESRVAHVSENERVYRVLDEFINTQPAVSYLKKVTFHEVSDGGH